MPRKNGDSILYSTPELSQLLGGADVPEIARVGSDNGLHAAVNGDWQLQPHELKLLFQHFMAQEDGASQEDGSAQYAIPESLRAGEEPWARTLVQMYGEKSSFPTSLSPDQGAFLKSLVCNIGPRTVLEIGCFTGISTIWLASGLEEVGGEGALHSVDVFNPIYPAPPRHFDYLDTLQVAQNALDGAWLSHRVQLHQADSKRFALNLRRLLKRPVDLLFIDGDHSVKGCLADFLLYYRFVAVGGYIVLHDINPESCGCTGPRFVIDRCIRNSAHFEIVEVRTRPHNHGMALIRKRSRDPKLRVANRMLRGVAPVALNIQDNLATNASVKAALRKVPVLGSWL